MVYVFTDPLCCGMYENKTNHADSTREGNVFRTLCPPGGGLVYCASSAQGEGYYPDQMNLLFPLHPSPATAALEEEESPA